MVDNTDGPALNIVFLDDSDMGGSSRNIARLQGRGTLDPAASIARLQEPDPWGPALNIARPEAQVADPSARERVMRTR